MIPKIAKMKEERGTTFLEILLVISIIGVTSLLFIIEYRGMMDHVGISQLSEQLQQDLNWALQYADTYQQKCYLDFYKERYTLSTDKELLLERSYTNKYTVTTTYGKGKERVIIQRNGTIHAPGTITIKESQGKGKMIKLYLQLSTGSIREERL